jgi:methylated-DNA-[protein]-cysteine S-methyltransferase
VVIFGAMPEKQEEPTLRRSAEVLRVLFPSPIGTIGLELAGETVTRLLIEPSEAERRLFTPFEDIEGSEFLDEAFGHLSEYFAGARRSSELSYDLSATPMPSWQARVLHEVAKIPFGRTRTYQRIATASGMPDGYRQVLAALVENPIPILVPCHRVVTNKSGVGSYIGGKEKKKWLLAMEKEAMQADVER